MSQEPLGHGWWRASDGRWYPPQQPPWQPPPRPRHDTAVVLAVVFALLLAIPAGLGMVGAAMGIALAVTASDGPAGTRGCDIVSEAFVGGVLGNVQLYQADGEGAPPLDDRVLPVADRSCWGTTATGRTVRIAEDRDGGELGFDTEVRRAYDTDGPSAYGGALSILGDEAFCTPPDPDEGAAGVLVRAEDLLVYVSVTPGDTGTVPEDGGPDAGLQCGSAQTIAAVVIASAD